MATKSFAGQGLGSGVSTLIRFLPPFHALETLAHDSFPEGASCSLSPVGALLWAPPFPRGRWGGSWDSGRWRSSGALSLGVWEPSPLALLGQNTPLSSPNCSRVEFWGRESVQRGCSPSFQKVCLPFKEAQLLQSTGGLSRRAAPAGRRRRLSGALPAGSRPQLVPFHMMAPNAPESPGPPCLCVRVPWASASLCAGSSLPTSMHVSASQPGLDNWALGIRLNSTPYTPSLDSGRCPLHLSHVYCHEGVGTPPKASFPVLRPAHRWCCWHWA